MPRNPYSPPKQSALASPVAKPKHSKFLTFVSFACAAAFIGFTIVLLQAANRPDHNAGRLFLLNVPIVGAWAIENARRRAGRVGFAVAAAVAQIGIAAGMLFYRIGDLPIILFVNGGIAALLLLLAYATWQVARSTDNT